MIELRTLGELSLRDSSGRVLTTRRKELALLTCLLRRGADALTARAVLADLLWNERDEAHARHSLRQALVHLRRFIGTALVANADAVGVRPGSVVLDVLEFEADVAAERWAAAVARWHGEFLAHAEAFGSESFRAWIDAEREGLRWRLDWAYSQLVLSAERAGRADEAVAWAERWTAHLPLSDRAQTRLLETLAADGRTADALARYAAHVSWLEHEFGVEPSPELAALGQDLENQPRIGAGELPTKGSIAFFGPALSGRDAVLGELWAAWRSAGLGTLQTVVIEGDEGSGKTRLCDEFLRRLTAAGEPVVTLRASGRNEPSPTPWMVARALLAPLRDAPGLGGAPDVALAELASLVPSIRERYPALPPGGADDAKLGHAVIRVLRDVAAELPVLLILDDAHAADAATRELVAQLVRSEREAPMLVVLTVAADDARTGSAIAALRDVPRVRRIRLAPLTPADIDHMLASMLALETGDRASLAAQLRAETGGNPRHVRRRVEALVATGQLTPGMAGVWRLAPASADPAADSLDAATARPPAAGEPKTPRAARRGWRTAGGLIAAALSLSAVALVSPWLREARAPITAVIAVGEIADHADSREIAAAIPDMLATNLSRIGGLRVLSNARVNELHGQLLRREAHVTLARAAREAGAQELVEGSLYRRPDGRLRLDLRRTDLRSLAVLASYRAEAADPFDLVDRATLAFLPVSVGRTAAPRIADVTTSSIVAYRLYAEGLRAYHQGDAHSARRFFDAAVAEDSLFAMATHYLAHALEFVGAPGSNLMLIRAAHLAERATDRERLLIHTAWADAMEEPSGLARADSLAERYPLEPDGHFFLGRARLLRGEFAAAVPHFRRVIAMDTLALAGATPRCRACDAFAELVIVHMSTDSLARAEQVAREWLQRQPGSGRAWHALAATLEYAERYDEARDARRRGAAFQPGHRMVPIHPALIEIRAGDFAAADGALRAAMHAAAPDVAEEARWFLAISLRYQGRLREALATATPLRTTPSARTGAVPPFISVLEAQILFEQGRYHDAAALFDSIAATMARDEPEIRHERNRRAWLLAHAATARSAADDTAALPALADEIEALGRKSALGRDRRLHQHVRGLLLQHRGRPEEAALAFRQALYSRTRGYTRTNYELARTLLELNRPQEAIAALRPALTGPLEASNLYLSRTELRALLGRAYEANGQPDSAAVHYQWVLAAWHDADPQFTARRAEVRSRLQALLR
jgi:DNA-binding SARP family transcriptional activator/tetratricopeptide (TPR) repeat protein/TolB-like protein